MWRRICVWTAQHGQVLVDVQRAAWTEDFVGLVVVEIAVTVAVAEVEVLAEVVVEVAGVASRTLNDPSDV